ncbi:3-hydroxybutyryl-CoA dehydrogenase [Streptomyces sp. DSM 40484]|uniref:3-hydroxybutyryl-CoA dehydrogenase n=1 Tax=Streptomyces kroppenstedtii TaxID=3051181 RepID=UPI0028D833C5|nr:3-hydroxybutyryl-CoA dehydrogenase [Streptomyces sp. DSM 40484]
MTHTDPAPVLRVGVVGCGIMGAGIAEVCARRDLDVLVAVTSTDSERRGRRRLQASLDRAVASGKLSVTERDGVLENITFTTDLGRLRTRQFTVEAITEDEKHKHAVLRELDRALPDPSALLASTTSSLSLGRLCDAVTRKGRFLGAHFFSPAQSTPLVELIGTPFTDGAALDRAELFLTKTLGKEVIRAGDRSGFVVNRLLVPYLVSAVRMLESGFAGAEDIDRAMVLGCAHPVGPLKLADHIGLDTVASAALSLFTAFAEPQYEPPALLRQLVDEGRLGRKTGRGFYDYPHTD